MENKAELATNKKENTLLEILANIDFLNFPNSLSVISHHELRCNRLFCCRTA